MIANTNLGVYKRATFLIGGFLTLLLSAYIIGAMIGSEEFGFLPLALVLGLSGAVIILRHPSVGFALMIFLIPLGPVTSLVGGERTITLAVAVLLLGVYGARVLILHEKIKYDRVSQLACAFVGWGIITSLWAYSPELSLSYILRLSQMIALYVLILNYCRTQRQLDILTLSFAAGAAVAAFAAIFTGTDYLGTGRISLSRSFDPNIFSGMLVTGVIIMFYHFYKVKYKLLKILFILSIITVGYSIIAAQSRGAWVGVLASLLISIILTTRNLKLIKNGIIVLTVLIGVAVSAYYAGIIDERVIKRYETLFSGDYRSATANRNIIWGRGIEIVKDSFPLGVGFKNFGTAYGQNSQLFAGHHDPHSTFLAVLAETGLVGFALFMGILISLFKSIILIKDPMKRFILMWLFGSTILLNLSVTSYITPWFWFVIVLIALGTKLEKQMGRKVSAR